MSCYYIYKMAFQKVIIVLELIDVFNHHRVEDFYAADREWAREKDFQWDRELLLKIETVLPVKSWWRWPSFLEQCFQWALFIAIKATTGQRWASAAFPMQPAGAGPGRGTGRGGLGSSSGHSAPCGQAWPPSCLKQWQGPELYRAATFQV